ncbi:MAG: flavodoxin-dependent (E)-4-hydroxy-3-methylbut-2-enyl-diphosphate synthase [Pseudomonadota bacterium]
MPKSATRVVKVGGVMVGGGRPVRVQSMTNTDTSRFLETFTQVEELIGAGCDIVRLGVSDLRSLESFLKIQSKVDVPLVADIHFDGKLALKCIERGCAGVRINPGNIGGKELVEKIVLAAKKNGTAIRIGVNSGSLEKELLKKYKRPTPQALAESALNWAQFFEKLKFYNFKVSIKSSDIEDMVKANILFSKKSKAPLHIGLTEAGTLISGLIRSTLAVGELLKKGIGNTIRISLSSNPVNEVAAGIELLKSLGLRKGLKVISCPTCARTGIDVISMAEQVEREFSQVKTPLSVAVMGCVVNGPGEAKEADIGVAGGKNSAVIFVNGEIVKKVSAAEAYNELCFYIEKKLKGVRK